jgi:hypothetical protein
MSFSSVLKFGISTLSSWNPWAKVLGFIAVDALFPETKSGEAGKLADLHYMGSSYGSVWPRVWGGVRIGGIVAYLHRDSNGNHFFESVEEYKKEPDVYHNTCSGFVGFCEATLLFPDTTNPSGGTLSHRGHKIRKIWANQSELIFERNDAGVVILNPYNLETVDGTETQGAPGWVSSLTGLGSNTPASRGICGAYFHDFTVDKWGTIPQLSAEIVTDDVECGDLISDICQIHGLKPSQIDVTKCYNSRMPGGVGMSVTGFIWNSREEGRSPLKSLLMVYDIDMVEIGDVVHFIPRAAADVFDIDESLLGASIGGDAPKLTRKRKFVGERPTKVFLNYIDPANSYNQNTASSIWRVDGEGSDYSESTYLVLSSAQAQRFTDRTRDRFWTEFDEVNITLPMHGLEFAPGDVLRTVTGGETIKFRIERMTMAPIGVVEISGTIVDDDTLVQVVTGSAGNSTPISVPVIPSVFTAFSGAERVDADKSTPGFYIAATGGTGWRGGQVWYKLSTDSTYVAGPVINSRCVFGVTTGTLSGVGAVADTLDAVNTVGVDITASGGQVVPFEQGAVEAGSNTAWIGNELVGIVTPTLTSAFNYTLSDLIRGRVSSVMAGHASGERFVMSTNGIGRVYVPEAHVGLVYDVKVVSPGQTLGDVTAQTVTIAARSATNTEVLVASNSFGLTVFEADLGAAAKTGGSFVKSGFTLLEVGRPLLISQAVGPYTGKGTLEDEFEMGAVLASAKIISTTEIQVWWFSSSPMRGNVKFQICMG